jgi:tRNA G10  N-methylase Trm11
VAHLLHPSSFSIFSTIITHRYQINNVTAISHNANILLGAKCFGSDIDPRVLRGQMYAGSADRSLDSTKRDIFENFKSYNLEKPELIRMDNHLLDRHIQLKTNSGRVASSSDRDRDIDGADSNKLRSYGSSSTYGEVGILDGMFDVIVTDPPYGIRAGAKKSGTADIRASF